MNDRLHTFYTALLVIATIILVIFGVWVAAAPIFFHLSGWWMLATVPFGSVLFAGAIAFVAPRDF